MSVESPKRGLVISYFGHSVAVKTATGQVLQCHLRRNQPVPVVGDWVKYEEDNKDSGHVLEIEPRRSVLARGDGRGESKPLAANLDVMIIVMAPKPIFSDYLVDRYLVAAHLLHLKPILVINKTDLLSKEALAAQVALVSPYKRAGYTVYFTSAMASDGVLDLAQGLAQQTAVLVGPSGVGKSSIIAALTRNSIRVGEVSAKGTGKHTTTATTLYALPGGGQLIDSPGVREFNLWQVDPKELWHGFPEFAQFAKACRFRDCQHDKEPGCGVNAAVDRDELSKERLVNYHTLLKTLKSGEFKK